MVRTRSVYLWIASLLIVGALIYAILVVGDHITASYLKRMYDGFKYSDVEAIIAERREKEDLPQRARAIAEGYHSVMMPAQIEASEPLKALAEQLGAAPLAPHPKTPLYLCNEGYGLVKYTSDRFGFRNPDSAWDTQVDVVLIGELVRSGRMRRRRRHDVGNPAGSAKCFKPRYRKQPPRSLCRFAQDYNTSN